MRINIPFSKMVWTICMVLTLFSASVLEAAHTYGSLRVDKVCRVHDGDTFIADIAGVHPLIGSQISIRVGKIDTPEITDKRAEIKKLAIQAREYVTARLAQARLIELVNVQRDKYFRILADVFLDGNDLAQELIEQGLAKPYDGGTKSKWE